jgi:hypothetical protein
VLRWSEEWEEQAMIRHPAVHSVIQCIDSELEFEDDELEILEAQRDLPGITEIEKKNAERLKI